MGDLERDLTNWAKVDKRVSQLSNDIKILKEKRTQLGEILVLSLTENDLIDKKFDLPDVERSISFLDRTSQEGLTYTYLEQCFNEYFSNDTEKSGALLNIIKSNRKKTTKSVLKGTDL
jgi:hypothetical protein|tara:strand:- start:1297 stop:1650 length:354 start_codon:yes stop_codon:yes gene_type:complete